jgi:sugar-specific transcriptional regulator TrmB
MDIEKLKKLGLSDAESKIYFSVLKLGTCTVKDISKNTGFHRTNIYDILEQLKEKGLITYFREGKTTKYKTTDPNNLYEFIREKTDVLDLIFPELVKLHESKSNQIQVEIYKGKEGMKSALRDIIKTKKPLYAFGVKGQLREQLPIFAEQWLRDLKENKIPYIAIYTKKNLPSYYTDVRYVSEELSGPVATFIYADKININIWEPDLVCIVIKSKLVAEMYKKHFDLLWKIARRK